jgi:hypothetical protein
MPNWTDESGFSWFGILECKRCLGRFETTKSGEIPPHKCHGGIYESKSSCGEYHYPVEVKKT